ncbi:MAG TPA: phosphoglucomutase (alpha-D-glucose-1,6-bisphosphate-dependent) [Actinomycetota bacterium]|nr:phosphoglucomutase (alpha-D-glucose-1,6-bisphosphate-dependent) [Actinomycetota bacterium]
MDPRAGLPAQTSDLVDAAKLLAAYYDDRPDPAEPSQRVAFGTSGHRGSSLTRSFNEAHIVATTEAIRRYRAAQGVDGPLFIGKDTHALSGPALRTAVEVLTAAGVPVLIDAAEGFTPTPVVSHAILTYNRGRSAGLNGRSSGLADGIVVTPSHNPPPDGGFKYDPPSGGPAEEAATAWIQDEANRLLASGWEQVARVPYGTAVAGPGVGRHDYIAGYVDDLPSVVDIDAIRDAGLHVGVDPLGGASLAYWPAIGERLQLELDVVNERLDPTFGFMTLDWDGRIRMDPSSPYAMAGLLSRAGRFRVGFACDPDADRHGVVTPGAGLMNPNHYLSVVVSYLFGQGRGWPVEAGVGKTLVSTSMIDRVAASLGRRVVEVPVGFKWFVEGLLDGSLGFGGEESAGASLLRRDGSVWTTDKDGLVLGLLAVEITALTGKDPGQLYQELTERFGAPAYRRVDSPATPEQKAALKALSPDQITAKTLAGEPITAVLTRAPGNGAAIGGLKIVTEAGWAAMRPSGTEDVYKIYAESFRSEEHLEEVITEARTIVERALRAG